MDDKVFLDQHFQSIISEFDSHKKKTAIRIIEIFLSIRDGDGMVYAGEFIQEINKEFGTDVNYNQW